jgi:hypothetical protein
MFPHSSEVLTSWELALEKELQALWAALILGDRKGSLA